MHIAIIAGGPSEERQVSLESARLITEHMDRGKYSFRLIIMEEKKLYEAETKQEVDLNNFSLVIDGKRESFQFAFLMIHGRPAENGKLQGYLDWMGIPYSTSGVLSSAITFNKNFCKNYLRPYGIPMASSLCLRKGDRVSEKDSNRLGWPVFVKPNNNGSSVAVSKVHRWSDLPEALKKVWEVDDEAMIESFIEGVEFSASILKNGSDYVRFPITEIRPKKEFFDYEAKYLGASEEITPARLSEALTKQCLDLSEKIFRLLQCEGICRFDFILRNETFYFLEVNTIPGMAKTSMVPQQVRAKGWSISQLIEILIETNLP